MGLLKEEKGGHSGDVRVEGRLPRIKTGLAVFQDAGN
jgi:hypothetical protein